MWGALEQSLSDVSFQVEGQSAHCPQIFAGPSKYASTPPARHAIHWALGAIPTDLRKIKSGYIHHSFTENINRKKLLRNNIIDLINLPVVFPRITPAA